MARRDDEDGTLEQRLDDLRERQESGEESGRELFRQMSHIAVYLAYDLIDKLRFYEKETLAAADDEVDRRIPHMSGFLDELKTAYETFADVDF